MPRLLTNQPALLEYAHTYLYMCLYAHIAHGLFKSLGEAAGVSPAQGLYRKVDMGLSCCMKWL